MTDQPQLHGSIVAMVALASGIAANHPAMGQCQLKKLREYGIPEHQIATVIEVARHIRDEAAQQLDSAFDEQSAAEPPKPKAVLPQVIAAEGCGCTPTANGTACC
ncbi:MAG: hypothetical protein COX57_12415 [Alphaproteobacteria bacterium CG_4_10_14_0_2_um_filter_63_37]|nr:MAG: hypothetical protein AUJ55_04595 [Proteobacteria bacterium CG1_02_64_396]PJA23668.1 MAG: hypothetical protein COX57_12415 [Alphaproteobacteria bacterium CG_4_10_14_0_2_um_filter_63_37]